VVRTQEHFIGGSWHPAQDSERHRVLSPHDGSTVAEVALATPDAIDAAVRAARAAFDGWATTPYADRAALVRRLVEAYEPAMDELAELISRENGSPLAFSQYGQVGAVPALVDGFLTAAEAEPWEELVDGAFGPNVVRHEPVGVVGAITAWNVPQILIFAKLAPALLAGCPIVVKASPDAPLDALRLAEVVESVGLPEGVVSILVGSPDAGRALVDHPDVDKIAFTGSTAVGRSIAASCGQQLKRCSVELGGKSAAVVLDDADPERTAEGLRFASFINNGQACAAQTRVLVPRHRHDEFVDALTAAVSTFRVGDPLDLETEIGPLVNTRQHDRVRGYLELGVDEGARPVIGGLDAPVPEGGCYVAPTVFVGVENGMRIAQEEIFGPVVSVVPHDGDDDAVRLADDSPYGLGGSVWSADQDRAADVARRIRTGVIGVNVFAPAPDMPLGGFKASGIGREYGAEGLAEYTETKVVHGLKPAGGKA